MPLILLPNLLGPSSDPLLELPQSVFKAVSTIDGLIAENEKEGRKFLKHFQLKKKLQEMPILTLNEHTLPKELQTYLPPLLNGEIWGLISDAGLPCIADPGAHLVRLSHENKIPVQAHSGPSSLTLSLMLSGLPSQRFHFHGYISKDKEMRKNELKRWEELSKKEKATQVFIETPYRVEHALEACLNTLNDRTLLCLASHLTEPNQRVITAPLSHWKKERFTFDPLPTIFLFYA